MDTSTFVLCPGAGSGPEYWYRLTPLLEQAGHSVVPVALPNEPGATLADQAEAIVAAAGSAERVVLVAQSMAGFSAPLACDRLPVDWLVLVNAMVPAPGETAGDWWGNTGQAAAVRANEEAAGRDPEAPFDMLTTFFHDVPDEVVAQIMAGEGGEGPADSLFMTPFDRPAWPEVPTTVLAGREDRLFPFDFQVRVAQDRLGLVAEPLPGGHLLALSQPAALAERLLAGPRRALPGTHVHVSSDGDTHFAT